MSPTQRSLKYLRKIGWRVAITEHYNAFARVRQDLFGFIDLLAICPTEKPLAVQTTTKSNMYARVTKILELPSTPDVLKGGMAIQVHGWDGSELTVQEIVWDAKEKKIRVI